MLRIFGFVAALIGVIAISPPAHAQYGAQRGSTNGVISPVAASRLGLKRAWFTQIQMDRAQARITDITQHVSDKRFATKFVVKWEDGEELFSEEKLDQYGDPLGLEGAEKAAKDLVQLLKDKDIQATLTTHLVPEITVYVQTDRGTLQALDGATGKTKWVAQVGNRNYPTMAPGANDKFVGVINGSTLYVLDQASGKTAWERRLDKSPGAGPALTEESIYVPTVSGKMEVYDLEDPRRPPWYYQSTGRLMVQPTVATNSVSWATDRGYLYVGDPKRNGVRFRLETRDAIASHSTFLPPNRLFAASLDGYAYCVHEFNGEILWRFSAGDPMSEPPIATKEGLYLIAEGAGMYRINPDNGIEQWWSPRINKVLAVSKDRVYCMAEGDRFVVLDSKTGGRIDTVNVRELDLLHSNWQTDRIYVGTTTGVVQCLHEVGSDWPLVHNVPDPEESARPEVIQIKDGEEPKPEVKPVDPFGGAADPFAGVGGADDPKPDPTPADPFGGASDPFGGAADPDPAPAGGGGADPFGGVEDPFG